MLQSVQPLFHIHSQGIATGIFGTLWSAIVSIILIVMLYKHPYLVIGSAVIGTAEASSTDTVEYHISTLSTMVRVTLIISAMIMCIGLTCLIYFASKNIIRKCMPFGRRPASPVVTDNAIPLTQLERGPVEPNSTSDEEEVQEAPAKPQRVILKYCKGTQPTIIMKK